MTCREVLDFLMAYVDGELSAETRAEFERHLSVCPPCVDYLDSYRRTVALERQACHHCADDAAIGELPEELVRAILASRGR